MYFVLDKKNKFKNTCYVYDLNDITLLNINWKYIHLNL